MKPACDTTHGTRHGTARADAEALSARVLHALERVNWPAHLATLIKSAERSGAPHEVIEALEHLPDEVFGSFPEVSASIIAARLRKPGNAQRDSAAQE
ncbi:DUF2795 domain-containing protein [Paraburkholderia lycopersici]|uniref:DUF2795 domain-containing protein n=1 Tax=Paraburkholderia lycopersici TaxID=416944 RepID=A0A1G6V8I0_9BURK|nr:DUF2795 domain-containing protein [Paraburkholderia lycopersici]SDD50000.1 Protein of unknown function [Paraburkholderia lycopersici]